MLQGLYNRTLSLAAHPRALWALGLISFIESSFFPIPPDILLIPMILSAPTRAFSMAFVCTVSSVLGGLFGYAIGFFLFDTVGQPLLDFYGYADRFTQFADMYNDWGAWIVFIAGLTPFPYKVITIASGVTHLDPVIFSISSVAARGLRFFLIAALLWKFGEPIRLFIEKYLGLLTIIFVVLLLGGFVLLKYAA